MFFYSRPDLRIEIMSHIPRKPAKEYPDIPMSEIPWNFGPISAAIIIDEESIIADTIIEKTNRFAILFN